MPTTTSMTTMEMDAAGPDDGPLAERTLSVFTEHRVGLLGRVTSIFTRRVVNIESLTVSDSELPGVHRFTIVVRTTRRMAQKLAAQLERQVEVLKAFVHDEGEVLCRELALYKLDATRAGAAAEAVVAAHGATLVERTAAYWVVERVGSPVETRALHDALVPFGLVEFARSGTVALTRPMRPLAAFLDELEG